MSCSFTDRKMFLAGPIFLCRTKKLFTYGSKNLDRHKTFWDLLKDKAQDEPGTRSGPVVGIIAGTKGFANFGVEGDAGLKAG